MSDPRQAPQTAEEWQTLAGLLPPSELLSTASVLERRESSLWTDEELGRARGASIREFIRAGWKFSEGLLKRGSFSTKPSSRSPVPQPWERGYNPLVHSVAVRMGGELIAPGRYRLKHNGLIVNDNGCLVDQEACVGCGTRRDARGEVLEPDYRWTVRAENPNPFAPKYKQAWTYCRKCVTPQELESKRNWEAQQRIEAQRNARR